MVLRAIDQRAGLPPHASPPNALPAPPHPGARVISESRSAHRLESLVWLRRVRDRIDREYAQPLSVEMLARDANMSPAHLSRSFKSAFGEPPYQYLMTRRIERAMVLLLHTDMTVTETCFVVGCSSLGTFSTRFAELTGMSPTEFRRRAQAPEGIPSCIIRQLVRPVRNQEGSAHTRGLPFPA
jgi:AraC-like DNA-binding protein